MKILTGYPISPGIIAKKVEIIPNSTSLDLSKKIERNEVEEHIRRFTASLDRSIKEIDFLMLLLESGAKEEREILRSHQEMLKDNDFSEAMIRTIREELISAESAVYQYFERLINNLEDAGEDYIAQRKEDVQDIRNRIIRNLNVEAGRTVRLLPYDKIMVVQEVTPSLILDIKHSKVVGVISETGSPNSHSAIIAKSARIPVVFNVKNASKEIKNDDFVILDGTNGKVIVEPDKDTLAKYEELKKKEKKAQAKKEKLSKLLTVTKDKHRIYLMSNIEFPEEADRIEVQNSDGIGLFRTEFLYFETNSFPPAQKQFEIYRELIENFSKSKPIYLRTFDIGGDKLGPEFGLQKELNPNLGCRGIRFSLRFPRVFSEQLEAILRASSFGNIKIMLPMITMPEEVAKAKRLIKKIMDNLKARNIPFNENIEIGIMIEVPSAALIANDLAKASDFFSIGTNDLVQYTLAADRNNETLSNEYNYFNPAVLNLIQMTIESGKKNGRTVSLCGEMAGDPLAVPLLLGMGLEILSATADSILPVKRCILNSDLKKLQRDYQSVKNKSQKQIKQFYTKLLEEMNLKEEGVL